MIKRIVRRLRDMTTVFIGNVGNMETYYKIARECAEKEMTLGSDNACGKHRKKILHYAQLVAGQPFVREKASGNAEIWASIRDGKLQEQFPNEVRYIQNQGALMLYPYPFREKYHVTADDVLKDEHEGLCYVLHKGKKLYFPEEDHAVVAEKYYQLIMEQDQDSPHRYFPGDIPACDVFVDVGSAEGIISLEAMEKAGEVYLLECSQKWIEALTATFAPYQEKTHIIRKYGGAYDDEDTITLDSLLKEYIGKKIVIKMDIEGMELDALTGCKQLMKKNDCRFSCATYHTNTAYADLEAFFTQNCYRSAPTKNYMLFIYGNMTLANGKYQRMQYPYFRHGLIRAEKP